eukprot:TRINITY_DN16115_c0_g1_i2.p2 TRINITY_DN16115_c0_g1~~TRINITY_DN16115_c0_g1_i2.p2  ORF type:complete len:148 (+),score=31.12 TRINITY_DN16115_c0_g1_i2:195-638(+)
MRAFAGPNAPYGTSAGSMQTLSAQYAAGAGRAAGAEGSRGALLLDRGSAAAGSPEQAALSTAGSDLQEMLGAAGSLGWSACEALLPMRSASDLSSVSMVLDGCFEVFRPEAEVQVDSAYGSHWMRPSGRYRSSRRQQSRIDHFSWTT